MKKKNPADEQRMINHAVRYLRRKGEKLERKSWKLPWVAWRYKSG
jgi:hypothetical protein